MSHRRVRAWAEAPFPPDSALERAMHSELLQRCGDTSLEESLEDPHSFPEGFTYCGEMQISGERTRSCYQVHSLTAMEILSYKKFERIGKLELAFDNVDLNTGFQQQMDEILSYQERIDIKVGKTLLGVLSTSCILDWFSIPDGVAAIPLVVACLFGTVAESVDYKRKLVRTAFDEYKSVCAQIRSLYFSEKEPEPYR